MTLPGGTYRIGPDIGAIVLYTTRAGVASKVGHDLTITFDRWSGEIRTEGADLTSASLQVTIETESLRIVSGAGGVTPLSSGDRDDITATARKLLDVSAHPKAEYISTGVQPDGDGGGGIDGELTLKGRTAHVALQVTSTGAQTWHAETTVKQTDLGITPYKAFFGALRLNDDVRVEADVDLSHG